MKHTLFFLPFLLVGCSLFITADPEDLFQEHMTYMKGLPVPEKGKAVVATGVYEDESEHHMLALLTPEGVELVCRKATEGTLEERVIASKLYTWYVGAASVLDRRIPPKYDSDTNKIARRCANLVNIQTMMELHDGLEALKVPAYLQHHYEDCDFGVKEIMKKTSNKPGLEQPATPTPSP